MALSDVVCKPCLSINSFASAGQIIIFNNNSSNLPNYCPPLHLFCPAEHPTGLPFYVALQLQINEGGRNVGGADGQIADQLILGDGGYAKPL
jgi:hypothetical protein